MPWFASRKLDLEETLPKQRFLFMGKGQAAIAAARGQKVTGVNIQIKYNVLFDEWQEGALDTLLKAFEKHIASCDNTFIDFANHAENVNIQNMFMDAQRELWQKSSEISSRFASKLGTLLKSFPAVVPKVETPTHQEDELDLVNLDAYEERLALQALSDQFERNNSQLVFALQQRLTVLNHGKPIESKQIPASAFQLSRIYSESLADTDIGRKPMLVMYTQFEKHVIGELPALFESLNQRLVESGILPSLKYVYRKAAEPTAASTPKEPGDEQAPEGSDKAAADAMPAAAALPPGAGPSPLSTSEESLQRIRDLLLSARQAQAAQTPQAAPGANKGRPATPATMAEVVQAADAIGVQMQQHFPEGTRLESADEPTDLVIVDRKLLTRVSQVLRQHRERIKDKAGTQRLDANQEDVIDIVGMLFDQMLDDDQLHGRAKAILSHLHTTYIKIGLKDADFLTNPEHPARRYFEQAIESSRRWVNDNDLSTGITPLLRNQVLQVVKYRKQENQDFERCIEELLREHQRLEEKSLAVEKRVLEAEQGKARLEHAKNVARQVSLDLFGGQQIPHTSEAFVNNVWIDYLTLLLLRNDGDQDNQDWRNAIALAEDLVIQSKLATTGHAEGETIEDLADALHKTVGRLLPQHNRIIDQFIDSLLSHTDKETVVLHKSEHGSADLVANSNNDELVNLLKHLANLPRGTQFEFDVDLPSAHRGWFSWFNQNTERFFFVDMQGRKLALIPAKQLLEEMAQGKIRYFMAEQMNFWDKAMASIRKLLEKATPFSSRPQN